MDREVRISPDGNMVAVRTDQPEDAWNAWGVIHHYHGGHWSDTNKLADWLVVTATQAPEPQTTPESS